MDIEGSFNLVPSQSSKMDKISKRLSLKNMVESYCLRVSIDVKGHYDHGNFHKGKY